MDNSKTTRQILKTQIKRYIQAGIKPKILPFVYLATYLIFFPMFLYKLIPEKTQNSFFSQQNIFHISLILGNTLTVLFYAISMYFVYTGKYQFLQKYRVNKKVLWPWEKDQKQWRQLLKKTITTLFFNCLVIGPLVLLIGSQFFQIKIIIYSQEIPSKFTIIWQFFLFMIVEDMTSTITHSQLHNSYLYFLHKKHHQYKTSISITAQYATPIQFVFSNSFPTIIGFLVLSNFYPVHLVSAITWLIFRILITSDVHCGYEWPWDPLILIPFSAPAPYHDFHHSHNVGNYGSSMMFWQAIFGTNKQYFKYIQQKQKQNKQSQKLC